ncbi:MAG: hypothetical protein ACT4QF_08570 [Sporichthyaceae bacterium]
MARSGRWVGTLALSALLVGGLSACGGGGEDEDQAAAEDRLAQELGGGLDNEAVLAEPSIVVEGLTEIKNFLNDIKNNPGGEAALEANDAMVPIWDDIEGRIKTEDAAAHAQFEAQFLALKTAVEAEDKDRSRAVADELIRLADAYLAVDRSTPSTPSPSPSVSTGPSGTAIPSSTPTPSGSASPAGTASPSATASPTGSAF